MNGVTKNKKMRKPLDERLKALENLEIKPSPLAWERVQAELGHKPERRRIGAWYGVAAAAALFITVYTGYTYLQNSKPMQGETIVAAQPKIVKPSTTTTVNTPINAPVNKTLETPKAVITKQIIVAAKPQIQKSNSPVLMPTTTVQKQDETMLNPSQNTDNQTIATTVQNEKITLPETLLNRNLNNLIYNETVIAMNLPELSDINPNENMADALNKQIINNTCRQAPDDATFSEKLIAFADCKTRELIKKANFNNVATEYKHLRGY